MKNIYVNETDYDHTTLYDSLTQESITDPGPNIYVKLYVYLKNETILLHGKYFNVLCHLHNNSTNYFYGCYCRIYIYENNSLVISRPFIHSRSYEFLNNKISLIKISDIKYISNNKLNKYLDIVPGIKQFNPENINLINIGSGINYILTKNKIYLYFKNYCIPKLVTKCEVLDTYRKLPRQNLRILNKLK